MFLRLLIIHDKLIQVSIHTQPDIHINIPEQFKNKVEFYTKILEDFDQLTVSLQSRHHILLDCRNDLDSLIEALHEQEDTPGSSLYECKLCTEYLCENSKVVTDAYFESSIVKFQKGEISELSQFE